MRRQYGEIIIGQKRNKGSGLPLILKNYALDSKKQPGNSGLGPKDTFRLLEENFSAKRNFSPMFKTWKHRTIVNLKVANRFGNQSKKKSSGHVIQGTKIETVQDLNEFRRKYTLKLPVGYVPQRVTPGEHMIEVAKLIAGENGPTEGVPYLAQYTDPHRDLIALPVPEDKDIDPDALKVIKEFRAKRSEL